MHITHKTTLFLLIFILAISLSACEALSTGEGTTLNASGVIEAVEIAVSSETGGRVVEVLVEEGGDVSIGQALFRLDDTMLQEERLGAVAALASANANLELAEAQRAAAQASVRTAQASVHSAELQVEIALAAERASQAAVHEKAWNTKIPKEFNLPAWYFSQPENLASAEGQVEVARAGLERARAEYERFLAEKGQEDLLAAEKRLKRARADFAIAQQIQDRRIQSPESASLQEAVDSLYDNAKAELEAAQSAYDELLSERDSQDLLEARARLAVAQARYELALDQRDALRTGEYSLPVEAARAAVRQAQVGVEQAEANLAQAVAGISQAQKAVEQVQAQLGLLDKQIERLTVSAPTSGVVLVRSLQPGEVLTPGATALTIGRLERLTITVYLPEDQYGQVSLGQSASVKIDSYPNQVFEAQITRIADRAEYTPRNVQTPEDRATTVFAIELVLLDAEHALKPGMPADVSFDH